jgi:hypothetical protein
LEATNLHLEQTKDDKGKFFLADMSTTLQENFLLACRWYQ